jgi:rod shape-determining protein MreC
MERDDRRSRAVLGLLLLASFTVITVDAGGQDSSPVDPLRAVAGSALGPVESAFGAAVRPVESVRAYFGDVSDLRTQNSTLAERNADLAARLRASELARQRARQLDALLGVSRQQGLALVPAQVVALGSAQTFSRTATIDAGTRDGVDPDMTVLAPEGLVGRVIRADALTATVLLAVDPESVVGGRLAESMELGFVRGDGALDEAGRLSLDLVDDEVTPRAGDRVLTWGSRGGAPYVAGVPIGRVVSVQSSPSELSTTATLRPYVDFSALDLVGVVADARSRDPRRPLVTTVPIGVL